MSSLSCTQTPQVEKDSEFERAGSHSALVCTALDYIMMLILDWYQTLHIGKECLGNLGDSVISFAIKEQHQTLPPCVKGVVQRAGDTLE